MRDQETEAEPATPDEESGSRSTLGPGLLLGALLLLTAIGFAGFQLMDRTVTKYLGEPLPLVAADWKPDGQMRVLLDPGHGAGTGSPKRPWTDEESAVNLRVSKHTGEVLGSTELYKVFFTRLKESQDPSIGGRARQAATKRADVFLSIHANATGSDPLDETRRRGIMVIWSPFQKDEKVRRESEWLANFLGAAYVDAGLPVYASRVLSKVAGLTMHGGFVATNASVGVHADGRKLGVLKGNRSPAVLVETHFLNNRSDVQFFQSDDTMTRFAKATDRGLRSFQAWKEGVLTIGDPNCCTYVQVASREDAAEAKTIAKKLKSVGVDDVQVASAKVDGTTWYRVRLGPYRTPEEVDVARNGLEHHGYKDVWVVHEDEPEDEPPR